MHRRKLVRDEMTKYAHSRFLNRSHYLKWRINDEWSIRYFFVFDKASHFNKKYVLKSHYTKDYIQLTKIEALDYVQCMCKEMRPQEFFSINEIGVGYRRIVMDPVSGFDSYMERYLKGKRC